MKKPRQILNEILAVALLFSSKGYAIEPGATAKRATFFNQFFEAPAGDYLNAKVSRVVPGVRNLKTVLPGTLYRAGGAGGQTEISARGRKALCEAGFERAYYLYPQGFTGRKVVDCAGPKGTPNTFEYVQANFVSIPDKLEILKDVKKHLEDAHAGPVLVHCWNGFHASGEIAAVALMQFCGFTPERAEAYWMKNQVGAKMISRIGNFNRDKKLAISKGLISSDIDQELAISSELRDVVCPKE